MSFQSENNITVSSLAESALVELICKDEKIDPSIYFECLSTVYYSASQKTLRFISLKEFWTYGLAIKRYLEYPEVSADEAGKVFEEIDTYLQQGDYVAHLVNGDLDCEDMNIITNISNSEKKVYFITWQPDGKMKVESLLFNEYCQCFFFSISSKKAIRFDIFHLVESEHDKFNGTYLETIVSGNLSVLDRVRCLFHRKKYNDFSSRVLSDWFLVFEDLVRWMWGEGLLQDDSIITQSDRLLFGYGESKKCRELYKMLVRYNALLRSLGRCFIRR